jgi:hypothetical protein
MPNPCAQCLVNGFHFPLHTDVTLRITLIANYANRRLMDKVYFGSEFAGYADRLGGAPRMRINQNRL